MKSIIIYYSETKNTEKVAKVIAEAVAGEIKKVENVRIDELADYDLIFIGTPVHGFRPAKKVGELLDKLPQLPGKKVAAFCTMHGGGDNKTFRIIKAKIEEKGATFIDGFSCLGWSRLFANFGPKSFNKGHPNKDDLTRATDFAKRVIGNN